MEDKLSIMNFEPGHFQRMKLRREDAEDLAGLDPAGLTRSWEGGRTLLKGGEPVMIYGFSVCQGTATLWAVTSPLLRSLPLFVTRLARNGIQGLFQAGVHRIEVYCHARNMRSLVWLTRILGFRVEGLMRCCGPNRQDRFLLAVTNRDVGRRADAVPEKVSKPAEECIWAP